MERVKKALEKANERRKNISSEEQSFDRLPQETPIATDEIKYQHTKTIAVSDETFRKNHVVAALNNDNKADLFKILRTKIIQRMRVNQWNVLAVTSPTASVGKSFISSNIAVSMAMDANYSVLLADLDLRRPSLYRYFDIDPDIGIRDYLEDDKSIAELLINPGLESLVVLPAGKPIRRSSELLSTPKMQALASELKRRYANRIVIIDLPPLLHTDDAMMFMPNVDACLLVVAEGESTEDEIKQSLQLIDETKFIGTVLNKSADQSGDDYYY